VELLGETEHLGFAALEGDALGFLREAGSRVAAAVGELPRAGEEVDVDRVLDVEVRSAAVRGLSVRLVRLPGSSRGVRGDSTVLSRVVAELLENAARHAPGAAVVVTVGADQSSMLITVTDDGPGIASRDPSAPFTPGWCAPSEVRPQGGMGLAIARWLVESAGGSLAWDPDQAGTVMTITLPLAGPVTSSEARGAGASVADSASASMTTSVSSR
jgi:K+-sensing histidine kinase KdpD